MKKLIAIFAVVIFPGFAIAQETPLSSLYTKFVSEPGFETTEILPGSTSYDWEESIESGHIKDMIKDIESVRILEYKGEGKYNPDKLWKKMTSAVDNGMYTEVVNVGSDKEKAVVYMLKESNGVFREIALIARDDDGITMVTVTGNIDLKKIFSPETMESLHGLGKYYMKDHRECGVK